MTDTKTPPENSPRPGIYRHYKGNDYQVLGMARHSETEEWLVVYQALYAERGIWVRPLAIWLEPTASQNERFSLLEYSDQSLADLTNKT